VGGRPARAAGNAWVTGGFSNGRATGSASVGGGASLAGTTGRSRQEAAAARRADGACSCSGASGSGPVGIVPATGWDRLRPARAGSGCSAASSPSSAACSASAFAAAFSAAAAAALRAAARRAAAFLAAAVAASEFGGAVLPGADFPGAALVCDLFLVPAAGTAGVSPASAARWSGTVSGRMVRTG
jgi:hypothetical protein